MQVFLLSAASLKNRALIALVTIVVAIFGTIALGGLKQELAPSVQFPTLVIVTQYPGAAPEVVNEDISTPIETAIQGIGGLESTSATSSTGSSVVNATFTYGTDLVTAEQKIMQAINRVSARLPKDVEPQVLAASFDDFPVVLVAVSSTNGEATDELAARVRQTVLPDLADIDGVREAALLGDPGKRVTIVPDADKLAAAGLSQQSIQAALLSNGTLIAAGSLVEDGKNLSVQAGVALGSVADIERLPLLGQAGSFAAAGAAPGIPQLGDAAPGAPQPAATSPLTIADVATVTLENNPIRTISRVNGEDALSISVTKKPAANTVTVSNAVNDALPGLAEVAQNVEFTVIFDQSPYIENSIETLATEGLLGLLFAVIIILVFLFSIRATLVTAISIPTSVLITFLGLQAADYSLNILTLGALTIAIGRVVDDSIVVIENITKHLGERQDREAAIVRAVREVAGAITASTVTTVAVFLPLAFVAGQTGELFRPFALTVTIALLASLLVSLTIVPVLAYWFLKPERRGTPATPAGAEPATAEPVAVQPASVQPASVQPASAEPASAEPAAAEPATAEPATGHPAAAQPAPQEAAPVLSRSARSQLRTERGVQAEPKTRLQRVYDPMIHWTLRKPVATLLLSVLILVGTFGLAPFMKTNFIGSDGQNTFGLSQVLPSGASLETQSKAAETVEQALLDIDGIETVQLTITIGADELQALFGPASDSSITYNITTAEGIDQQALQAETLDTLRKLDGVGEIQLNSGGGGFGGSSTINVDITAPDQETLRTASDALIAELSSYDTFKQVESNLTSSRPYIAVQVDRMAAAKAGLSESALSQIVAGAMAPTPVGSIVIENTTLTVYTENDAPPTSVRELTELKIPTLTGEQQLGELATVSTVDGPVSLTTVKGVRSATIAVDPAGDDLGAATVDVNAALAKVELPAGANATISGVSADQEESFKQLGIALLVAILIVYIVMVATFKSLLQPLVLLISVPFAATGAIVLQVVTGVPLGVPSLIGVLMLVGIVVTNAIVLVDLVNQYRTAGIPLEDAVAAGSSRRLRPILMTALATIFALVPMATGLTGDGGGFISQPLAIVVIGGLLSSTVLTLIVLPTLYFVVERRRERVRQRRADRAQRRAERRADRRAAKLAG